MRLTCTACEVFWNDDDLCFVCGARGKQANVHDAPNGCHVYRHDLCLVEITGQPVQVL